MEQRFRPDIIDIHCHVLPGLDDGPATMPESLQLCRRLVQEGVRTVVATPHQLGRYDTTNSPERISEALVALRDALAAAHIALEVLPGADVRIDERLVAMVRQGGVLTLGGSGYLLVELPHDALVTPTRLLKVLAENGIRAVLSHPERHAELRRSQSAAEDWLAGGAILQVTAGSLTGHFGPEAESAAWDYLSRGMVHVIASDAHDDDRRPPRWRAALQRLTEQMDVPGIERMVRDNPAALLSTQRQ